MSGAPGPHSPEGELGPASLRCAPEPVRRISLRSGISGISAPGTSVCPTGEQPGVPGSQRIGRGAMHDHAEQHGDRDDSYGMTSHGTAQFLQGQEGEHH